MRNQAQAGNHFSSGLNEWTWCDIIKTTSTQRQKLASRITKPWFNLILTIFRNKLRLCKWTILHYVDSRFVHSKWQKSLPGKFFLFILFIFILTPHRTYANAPGWHSSYSTDVNIEYRTAPQRRQKESRVVKWVKRVHREEKESGRYEGNWSGTHQNCIERNGRYETGSKREKQAY